MLDDGEDLLHFDDNKAAARFGIDVLFASRKESGVSRSEVVTLLLIRVCLLKYMDDDQSSRRKQGLQKERPKSQLLHRQIFGIMREEQGTGSLVCSATAISLYRKLLSSIRTEGRTISRASDGITEDTVSGA